VGKYVEFCEQRGVTPAQFALAWVKSQPGITSPIIGPRTMEQFEDNLGALNVELNEEDLKFIDSVCRPGDSVAPYYEADFGPHMHRV
jgi:aryl-alcohol dehydrogenase-like predicted oxidoreductase